MSLRDRGAPASPYTTINTCSPELATQTAAVTLLGHQYFVYVAERAFKGREWQPDTTNIPRVIRSNDGRTRYDDNGVRAGRLDPFLPPITLI